ncbi:MAG TPA: efflux RND transporter permease subunit, partial [Steroidobacteraceae bacterium]|nr:efflux RND transporter permease subunit [Steroidobacteraceae bacterium]
MKIWEFSVRRWQFTLVLFGLLIAMGLNAYLNIPRSEDPEFHAPVPTVVAVYPGADPADIERLVIDPLEDAINELDEIKRMDSRSMDGVGVLQIEFHWDQDADEKYDDVVREVNRIRPELPADLAALEVRKAGSGLVNIVQLALVSEDAGYRQLKELAEELSDSIETVPGVRRSQVWAFPEPEVRVAVDLERMGRARVTLGQVEASVRGENATIPGGAVDVGLRKFNLKTSGSYDTLEEISETVVAVYPGADPADIERLVIDPLEDAINELDEIKRMDSRSMDGVGVLQIEFHWDQDADEKYDEVVREVNRIRPELPADLAALEVRKAGSGLVNIVQLALVSEDAGYRQLKELAEELSDSIETVPGVRRSQVWAFPEPEVRVAVDL